MRFFRSIASVLLGLALLASVFLHVISATWWFNIGTVQRVPKGQSQRQRYVQLIKEPGTFLLGSRTETKMTDIDVPGFTFKMESPVASSGGSAPPNPKGNAPRKYSFGMHVQKSDRPEMKFEATYVYLRFWLVELVLVTALAVPWLPVFIRWIGLTLSRRRPPPSTS